MLKFFFIDSESPTYGGEKNAFSFGNSRGLLSPTGHSDGGFHDILAANRSARATPCNEISAPYEVPQFPIEEIERKLAIQRQLSIR